MSLEMHGLWEVHSTDLTSHPSRSVWRDGSLDLLLTLNANEAT